MVVRSFRTLLGEVGGLVACALHPELVGPRLLQGVEVLALDVLDQCHLEGAQVIHLLHDGWDLFEAREFGGAVSSLAGDDLVACRRRAGPRWAQ
jgi:hypothetical protein